MSDMSKWPPSKDGRFTQAWINLDKLPGGMMQSYSAERGHFTYGPIPALTSCVITTNPDDAERWRAEGKPVLAIYTAAGVQPSAECPNVKGNPRDGYYCDECGSGPCTRGVQPSDGGQQP